MNLAPLPHRKLCAVNKRLEFFQRAASTRPLSVSEGIPAFTTAHFLAAGISGPSIYTALPLSYSNFRC
jgi:hypothetical protein